MRSLKNKRFSLKLKGGSNSTVGGGGGGGGASADYNIQELLQLERFNPEINPSTFEEHLNNVSAKGVMPTLPVVEIKATRSNANSKTKPKPKPKRYSKRVQKTPEMGNIANMNIEQNSVLTLFSLEYLKEITPRQFTINKNRIDEYVKRLKSQSVNEKTHFLKKTRTSFKKANSITNQKKKKEKKKEIKNIKFKSELTIFCKKLLKTIEILFNGIDQQNVILKKKTFEEIGKQLEIIYNISNGEKELVGHNIENTINRLYSNLTIFINNLKGDKWIRVMAPRGEELEIDTDGLFLYMGLNA